MMLVPTEKGLLVGFQVQILENDRVVAWAERSLIPNAAYTYLLGKYVEADKANRNGHYWSFADLANSQNTIKYSPLNMLHVPHRIVGSIIDAEMVYPNPTNMPELESASAQEYDYLNPYVEALAVLYKYYFPEDMAQVREAYEQNSLFFSMECVADSVTCIGANGCGNTYPFVGVKSQTYCEHINSGASVTKLNQPHFLGGAVIVPPVAPGWAGAEITDLMAASLKEHADKIDDVYEALRVGSPHLEAWQWEAMMMQVITHHAASQAQ